MKVVLEKDDIIECVEKALKIKVDRDKVTVKARPQFQVIIDDARNLADLPGAEVPEATTGSGTRHTAASGAAPEKEDGSSMEDVMALNRGLMSGESTEFPGG